MGSKRDGALHTGHRERMRRRFIETGIDGFGMHEILEMLLFYGVSRKDTNETAHLLLNKFGSLNGVLFADREELMSVPGVKENTATMLNFIGATFVKAVNETVQVPDSFDRCHKVTDYFRSKFFGMTREAAFMLLLDNGLRFIDCVKIGEGTVNLCEASTKTIISKAAGDKVSAVILAHNHPGGLSVPSSSDLDFTFTVNSLLETIGVVLVEHVIIGENSATPIMQGYMNNNRYSPQSNTYDREFYNRFYFAE